MVLLTTNAMQPDENMSQSEIGKEKRMYVPSVSIFFKTGFRFVNNGEIHGTCVFLLIFSKLLSDQKLAVIAFI